MVNVSERKLLNTELTMLSARAKSATVQIKSARSCWSAGKRFLRNFVAIVFMVSFNRCIGARKIHFYASFFLTLVNAIS